MTRLLTYSLLLAALTLPARPQALLAPTPPMGWNSWDAFGTGVTEAEVKANADYMASRLSPYGWQYIVVDIQWSEPNPKSHGYRPDTLLTMDSFGRLIPAPNRFPSSASGQGFAPLATYVHSKGLKFGIHILRGIPRRAVDANLPIFASKYTASEAADRTSLCRWNTDMYGVLADSPAGQAYYDSIARLYASWGVDFIKADDMFAGGPTGAHTAEIAALRRALNATHRPIVLSLSPGNHDTSLAPFLAAHAEMWRISDDLWDRWDSVKRQFANLARWNPFLQPGHWPDADMLPLGHIGLRAERGEPRMSLLSHDEQRTLMTLWSVARSPLMFGGHLPDNDAFTLGLLTNSEVLGVNQHAARTRQLFSHGDQTAWLAELPRSNAKVLALFNTGDAPESISVSLADLGLPATCAARDLWAHREIEVIHSGKTFSLAPHASIFLKLSPA